MVSVFASHYLSLKIIVLLLQSLTLRDLSLLLVTIGDFKKKMFSAEADFPWNFSFHYNFFKFHYHRVVCGDKRSGFRKTRPSMVGGNEGNTIWLNN